MASSLHGIILVDKPYGKTSFDIVKEIRNIFKAQKAGHAGTLDPLATGLLPIAINEGTKLFPFLMEMDKTYEGTIELGKETETEDLQGKVISTSSLIPKDISIILEKAKQFEGEIFQIPPMYSALKYKGRPLYKWKRLGFDLERKERKITIHSFQITDYSSPYLSFLISCSKGTYIRTLSADLGRSLGCGACLASLNRIKFGHFSIKDASKLEELKELEKEKRIDRKVIPPEMVLKNMVECIVDHETASRFRNGLSVELEKLKSLPIDKIREGTEIKILQEGVKRTLLAIGRLEKLKNRGGIASVLKPVRVFNI